MILGAAWRRYHPRMHRDPGSGTPTPTLADVQESSYRSASPATRHAWPRGSALDAVEIATLLRVRRYAVLATTRPDGRPHAAPVAFVETGRRIWMASMAGAARTANLRRQPSASLVITGPRDDDDHAALVVEGPVRIHDDPGPLLDGFLRDLWRERFGSELEWAETILELTPTKVLSHGHGTPIGDVS